MAIISRSKNLHTNMFFASGGVPSVSHVHESVYGDVSISTKCGLPVLTCGCNFFKQVARGSIGVVGCGIPDLDLHFAVAMGKVFTIKGRIATQYQK